MLGVSVTNVDFVFIGYGAQWNNFAKPATVDDNFSLLDAMLMLLGSSGVYLVITWYVDGVFPGEYGVPLPWYFPLSVRTILFKNALRDSNFNFFFEKNHTLRLHFLMFSRKITGAERLGNHQQKAIQENWILNTLREIRMPCP